MDVVETISSLDFSITQKALEAMECSTDKNKRLKLKHVTLDVLDIPNQNNRLYKSTDVPLESLKQKAAKKELLLYVDHSWSDQPAREANKLERVGAMVDAVEWETVNNPLSGKSQTNVYADMTILNKGRGEVLREIIEAGGSVGFSKRGVLSEWKEQEFDGKSVNVPENYHFVGYDIVTTPAVKEAMTSTAELKSYEQVENNDNIERKLVMDKLTLEQVKADPIWPEIESGIQATLESTINDRIKVAVDEFKTAYQPLESVVEGIKTLMQEKGLIETRTPSAVEQVLVDKLKASEAEVANLTTKIGSLEAELQGFKNPTPVSNEAVETFFNAKPNGIKVLTLAKSQNVNFTSAESMESFYNSAVEAITAINAQEQGGQGEGKTDVPPNTPDEKEQATRIARENLAIRAGIILPVKK